MGLFDKLDSEENEKSFNEMPDELKSKLKSLNMKGIKSKSEMIKRLKDAFGEESVSAEGDALVVRAKDSKHEKLAFEDVGEAIHQALALNDIKWEKVISYMAESIELKPLCVDAKGVEVKRNDFLVAGGKRKRVLRVGYKYAILSTFEDVNAEDGVWFEDMIKSSEAVIEKDNE